LAGAVLFAVPVAVAAAIGFGTSISGVAGGLSAVTSGPDAVPAAQTGPGKLNNAVAALASRQAGSSGPASGGGADRGAGGGGSNGTGSGSGSGGSGSTGSGGDSGGSSSSVINTPATPGINLPGGGSTSDVTNGVNETANNLLGGVDKTVNGLLGGK
jgi:hypothetical protein